MNVRMEQALVVGMAEIKVLRLGLGIPDGRFTTLTALGLGSCIGICMYDGFACVAGMAHVVLPEKPARGDDSPGKFADTAVPAMLEEMARFGAATERIVAAIAGGAQLFTFESKSTAMAIGSRNEMAVEQAMMRAGVPILARELGGKTGRTLRLSVTDGRVSVKTIGQGERELIHLGETRPVAVRNAA